MGHFRTHALLLAAFAFTTVAAPRPATGQCRLCDAPTTTVEKPDPQDEIRLEIESSLDFDRLVLLGDGDGVAVVRPDGTRSAEGTVAGIGPRAMVGSATVHGAAGRAVRVELPGRIALYSLGGGRISVDDLVSDLPALPRLDAAGQLSFRFGGRVHVTGDSDGDYRGDLPITVEYQ
jgi:uncharacterized protein DUF4402